MKKLKELKAVYISQLLPVYGEREAASLFHEAAYQIDRIESAATLIGSETSKESHYMDCLEALLREIPIQYYFESAPFFGMDLKVNKAVLIPRPETEELVQWVCEDTKDSTLRIQDLGTGSGCIAIALAKELPNCQLMACDVSSEALALAQLNAMEQGVSIDFYECDLLNAKPQTANVFVSNPPYIPFKDRAAMQDRVLAHEPALALFVSDEDPLVFYRRIVEFTIAEKNRSPSSFVKL